MKHCKKYREYISARADGELNTIETIELKKHLEDCKACSDFAKYVENLKISLAGLSVSAPTGLASRISTATLNPETKPEKQHPHWQIWAFRGGLAAVATCIVLAAAFFSGMFDGLNLGKNSLTECATSSVKYEETNQYSEDAQSSQTDIKSLDINTLTDVYAVVVGEVVSNDITVENSSFSLTEIRVSKQYYSRGDKLEGSLVKYLCPCESASFTPEIGNEVIVFLSPANEGLITTNEKFFYMLKEGDMCYAKNFVSVLRSFNNFHCDGNATLTYPLKFVEEQIENIIHDYIR